MPVIIAQDKDEVISKLSDLIEKVSNESIEQNGFFSIGFSGTKYFSDIFTYLVQ